MNHMVLIVNNERTAAVNVGSCTQVLHEVQVQYLRALCLADASIALGGCYTVKIIFAIDYKFMFLFVHPLVLSLRCIQPTALTFVLISLVVLLCIPAVFF